MKYAGILYTFIKPHQVINVRMVILLFITYQREIAYVHSAKKFMILAFFMLINHRRFLYKKYFTAKFGNPNKSYIIF